MREGISPFGNRLRRSERLEVLERVSCGETQPQAARAVGTTTRTVRRVLAAAGGTPLEAIALKAALAVSALALRA